MQIEDGTDLIEQVQTTTMLAMRVCFSRSVSYVCMSFALCSLQLLHARPMMGAGHCSANVCLALLPLAASKGRKLHST
jgi:hypothetical protein